MEKNWDVSKDINCKKCNGKCEPSFALINPTCCSPEWDDKDLEGTALSESGKAAMTRCKKCVDCGHSFTK